LMLVMARCVFGDVWSSRVHFKLGSLLELTLFIKFGSCKIRASAELPLLLVAL
jgi:hypothetical protein